MNLITLPKDLDTTYMDSMLKNEDGTLKVNPASSFKSIPQIHIVHWCTRNGVYQIPTQELIDWLKSKIRDRLALEICAGNGVIGRVLGIKSTDSYMHQRPEIKQFYAFLGQQVTIPPADVEKLDGLEAVRKYRPKVVLGAWCTHWGIPSDKNSSGYGIHEDKIYELVETYIHIGNAGIHGYKPLLSERHETVYADWLIGRAFDPSKNCIYLWEKSN